MENMIKEVLDANKESITKKVREEIGKRVISSLSYSLQSKIDSMVSDFIKDEFAEEIKGMLLEAKPKIIKEMESGMVQIGAALAQCLTAKALENLEIGSYRSREIVKKIFD